MSHPVSKTHVLAVAAVGLGVLLAWWAMSSIEGSTATAAEPPSPQRHVARPAGAGTAPGWFDHPAWAAAAPPPPVPTPAAQPAPANLALVSLTLAAPRTLLLGEQAELVIRMGASATAGEVSLTVRFDPDVLQGRTAAPGDWAADAGADARFAGDIPEEADRVEILGTASGRPLSTAGGAVAVVQFQSVAPGPTTVRLADVTVKDLHGRPMPVLVSTPTLHVTVQAPPPVLPALARLPVDATDEPHQPHPAGD